MKKYCLILSLFCYSISFAQVKTLGKRKKPGSTTVNTGAGSVRQANTTANVSTVVKNNYPTVRMKLRLPLTDAERDFDVQKIGHHYVLNGDIIVGNDLPKTMSISQKDEGYRWSNAVMPIVVDPSIYSNGKGGNVHAAIEEFNSQTILCLVPRTYENDYVRITYSTDIKGGGLSSIGRQGGEQKLYLSPNSSKGTVLHELLHAAGFYHEQCRDDRDNFINIFYDNIQEDARNNFQKEGGVIRGGYDYCSIMHYGGKSFAIDETKPTIICIQNIETCRNCLGQREELSGQDRLGLEQYYNKVNGPRCNVRFPNPNIPQQFPSVTISESDKAMQSFRHRADYASQNGFAAGFPNFHEARQGINIVGGTILIKHGMIVWQDVATTFLGNPPMNDFAARMRATQDYATKLGFIGGFPNYHSIPNGTGFLCGTFLLTNAAAEWRDVPLSELGNPPLNDIRQRFTSANDYAYRNGYLGGFPTFYHADYGKGIVCGIILIKKEAGEWRDVIIAAGPR